MRWVVLSLVVCLAACVPVEIKKEQRTADTVPSDVSRTDDEIQAVFDQNKASLYVIYQRFLRHKAPIETHIIFSITIEPSGQVSGCSIHKAKPKNPDLGKAVCSEIRQFNFGPKNMSSITITYPIDFLPK
jgi:TonB family protein